ncbi:hypothetical protein AB0L85_31480 [Streptomyces sp. NPDC052051]|uniref:hypothetical protein n=1 Tax=Streptomyces sp. NPDC052051 TaxID=3154649 RepID=UPI00342B2415
MPDDTGIYTLHRAHQTHTRQLATRHRDHRVLEVTAPHTRDPYYLEARTPAGHPVLVIEPHHDDFALSASGTFLAHPRPLTVITVFTRSRSVHPALETTYADVDTVSELRNREGAAALAPFAARRHLLGHKDAEPPYRPYTPEALDRITANSAGSSPPTPAPNSSRPPPSPATPTTSSSTRRRSASAAAGSGKTSRSGPRTRSPAATSTSFVRVREATMRPELVDITDVVLDKVTVLRMHGSQMYPARKMYRPIRHAFTTAADLVDGSGLYAERFYRTKALTC